MTTKDEFLALYEKFVNGQCTAAEKHLLETYNDQIKLADDEWPADLGDNVEISNRIWKKIQQHKQSQITKSGSIKTWLKVAAVLLIGLSGGFWFYKAYHINGITTALPLKPNLSANILPGGNKAYLTTANGSQIVLNNIPNGAITIQAGVQVNKAKDGLIKYDAANTTVTTEYNTITTPCGGEYEVVLADGSKVMLNAASSLRFPVNFTGANRTVELSGEAYFEISKNKAKPFIVHAKGIDVRVLGTHFNVNAYSDNQDVTTTLLEGSVQLINGATTAMLIPGEEGRVFENESKINVKTADMEEAMAWKNGLFVFHDEKIVNVMKQVSRWYDVDVTYIGNVKQNEIGGSVSRYKSIVDLLNKMELTDAIHYKIKGRRVIIME